jgi:hypothetical protein
MDWGQLLNSYPDITRENVEAIRAKEGAHRVCFSTTHADQPKRSTGNFVGSFTVPFLNSIGRLFLNDTGLNLGPDKFGRYWLSIREEAQFSRVQNWVTMQGTRVFIRDCLDMSVALDFNFTDSKVEHTEMGALESRCKNARDGAAINLIVDMMCSSVSDMCGYSSAKFIAAVPARPGKGYDLPSNLASEISKRKGLTDLTRHFSFAGQKSSIKATKIGDKWEKWELAGLSFNHELKERPSVILIDDKYQSGITLQYVASRLRAAGAGEIYGLCVVKTLRDTDNS